jgi:hypothetical protein
VTTALGADFLLVGDLVFDATGDELTLLLGVLAPRLQRRDPLCLGAVGVADRRRDGRHLLRAFPEDVALELVDGGLHGGELFALFREQLVLQPDRFRLRGEDLLGSVNGAGRVGEVGLEPFRLRAPLATVIITAHWRL